MVAPQHRTESVTSHALVDTTEEPGLRCTFSWISVARGKHWNVSPNNLNMLSGSSRSVPVLGLYLVYTSPWKPCHTRSQPHTVRDQDPWERERGTFAEGATYICERVRARCREHA